MNHYKRFALYYFNVLVGLCAGAYLISLGLYSFFIGVIVGLILLIIALFIL